MSVETELVTLLKLDCARVFPDFAPVMTARPFVTYQHIGGKPLGNLDGTVANLRHSVIQINVWSSLKSEAVTLARAIETRLRAATVFIARPESEVIGQSEEDLGLYGTIQDFYIFSTR